MNPRSQRSFPQRHARSQLAQLITQQPFLRGSLVERARTCGKPTCRCRQGQLHRSLYRAVRHRALLYIPRPLQETVRLGQRNGRRLREQLETLNQLQLEQLLQRKQQLSAPRVKPKTARPDASP